MIDRPPWYRVLRRKWRYGLWGKCIATAAAFSLAVSMQGLYGVVRLRLTGRVGGGYALYMTKRPLVRSPTMSDVWSCNPSYLLHLGTFLIWGAWRRRFRAARAVNSLHASCNAPSGPDQSRAYSVQQRVSDMTSIHWFFFTS